jgi:ADP-ribose pyrophosphatase YjhB (NUDIX family)
VPASEYVLSLRERIGTDLLLLPTVAVLARDELGRLLLVRHVESERWATVGGTIEPDESPVDAAVRETQEEAGVTVAIGRLLTALGGPEYRLTYLNGDQCSVVSLVYEATVTGGEPRPDNDETSEVGWFHLEEVQSLELNEFNRRLLTVALPLLG